MLGEIANLFSNFFISKVNFDGLDEIQAYAWAQGVGINFTLAAISEIGVESVSVREQFELGREDKKKVISFFERLLEEMPADEKLYSRKTG